MLATIHLESFAGTKRTTIFTERLTVLSPLYTLCSSLYMQCVYDRALPSTRFVTNMATKVKMWESQCCLSISWALSGGKFSERKLHLWKAYLNVKTLSTYDFLPFLPNTRPLTINICIIDAWNIRDLLGGLSKSCLFYRGPALLTYTLYITQCFRVPQKLKPSRWQRSASKV